MAEVKLQVIVKREQVDALQKDIDKLSKTKIIINTQESNKNIQQTQKTLQQLEKTQQQQLKTEQERQKLTQQQARTEKEALRVEKERASVIGQKAKNEKEIARAEQENAKAIKEVHRAEQAAIKTERERAKATEQSAKATEQHGKATKEAAKQESFMEKILGRTTGEFIARMTVYRAVYAGIRAVTNGFQEAIQTLRAVDDELVTVRKVTGFDQYQMAGVENQAYAVASKYGASASDYVSGVASFARAGYKELSGDLAELAQKTVIVGDTTAEIANQFLLSVDAAYKYNGSVRELSKVLDAANELDNKYATSIEKIAEGMGIVAPVAAQMHVGVNELAAAIGTVTAVTQRSGTEAARALRALFLNIVGDTKTEIDEGVTWTTGEIAGLKDVIKQYAPEAYKAAQATGSIIDPMEAIGGLAKSMQEGLLTEQTLMEMVSDIGGKLRTSQLLALIQNWDMYNNMLRDTENAAGSADKEIENAMDSWTRKTNVLKNTWTEFIKSGLDSGQIKFLLDALTVIVQHLGTLTGAVSRLSLVLAALKLHSTARELTQISKGLLDVKNGASKAARTFTEMGVSAKSLNVAAGIIGGLALAWTAYSAIRAEIDRKHQERVQAIYSEADAAEESAKKILELSAEMSKAESGSNTYNDAAQTLAGTLGTDLPEAADKAILKLRELTAEQLKASAGAANTAKITAEDEYLRAAGIGEYSRLANPNGWRQGIDVPIDAGLGERIGGILSGLQQGNVSGGFGISKGFIDTSTIENAVAFRKALEQVNEEINEYVRATNDKSVLDSEYYKQIQEYLGTTAEAYAELEKRQKAAFDAETQIKFANVVQQVSVQSKDDLQSLIGVIALSKDYTEEEKDALVALAYQYFQFSDAVGESGEALNKQTGELYANQKALDANATSEERAAAAKKDAAEAARRLIPVLWDENGALSAVGTFAFEADKNLAGMVQSELEAQLAAKQANYSSLAAQLAMVGVTAAEAAQQIYQISVALSGGNPAVAGAMFGAFMASGGGNNAQALLNAKMAEIKRLMSQISSVSSYSGTAPSWSSSGGSSGGGSSHSSGGHSGGSSGSGSSSASTEDKKLTALQNRVSLLKSELSLMQERGDSEEDQIAKMREIMAALQKEADYLKSVKGDQVTINNLSQEWWNYNNKISELMDKEASAAQTQAEALQKALEAQKALNNALKDRSVRYYNAQTGQWEWTADAQNVASATKARDDAISAAGYDNLDAWNTYYKIASTMESIRAFADFVNAHPSVSIWDIPQLMQSSYTSNYGGTSNSTIYNFGGFNLTEQQAKGTSVYELAMRSRRLALHNSTY